MMTSSSSWGPQDPSNSLTAPIVADEEGQGPSPIGDSIAEVWAPQAFLREATELAQEAVDDDIPYIRVSLLMCAYNEQRTIRRAIREVLAMEYPCEIELVVVDDGSRDATAEIVAQFCDPRIILQRHPQNRGKGAALRTAASLATGTHVVPFDADLEYTPKDLPRLIEPILSGRFDVVYGARLFGYNTVYQSFRYAMGNKILTAITNVLFDSYISDMHTCLKLMPREMFSMLVLRENGFGLDTELTAALLRLGIRPFEVPVSYYSRSHAQGKKINWRDAVACLRILFRVRGTRKRSLMVSTPRQEAVESTAIIAPASAPPDSLAGLPSIAGLATVERTEEEPDAVPAGEGFVTAKTTYSRACIVDFTNRRELLMKMSVIGCGHLGATHAACMASVGHEVVGVDIDPHKVALLNSAKGWFHEPGLDPMLGETINAGRLRFTTDFALAAKFADIHFIGVATPGYANGSYDLSQLHAAVSALVPHLRGDHLIIGKCTVAPGTAAKIQTIVDGMLEPGQGRVEVVWNPEFLREGRAVQDTLRPDRIVVGTARSSAAGLVREVYRPLTEMGTPLIVTDLVTAELAKGAANAFLATKISFINAMADVCATTGGDIVALAGSLGLDPRIGAAFLTAGIGYGGACLPKDVRGLSTFARDAEIYSAYNLLSAVDEINASRAAQVVDLVRNVVGDVAGKQVAVWGAAFKAGTDDVRDSAGLAVADRLWSLGAAVTVYDPIASGNALVLYPELGYADSAVAAAAGADVVVVVTAWPEFADVDTAEVTGVMRGQVVVDACQGISLDAWRAAGCEVSALTGAWRYGGAGADIDLGRDRPFQTLTARL